MEQQQESVRRRMVATVVGTVVTVLLVGFTLWWPMPFTRMSPGPAINTLGKVDGTSLLTFGKGVTTYPTKGSLYFTTVSVTRAQTRLGLAAAMWAWVNPDTELIAHDVYYPDNETNKQSNQQSAAELASSQDTSKAAALRQLGWKVPETAVVSQVVKGTPAYGKLEAGDVIIGVDGHEVDGPDAAVKLITNRKPGATVKLTVERDGKQVVYDLTTTTMKDDPTKPRIGIALGTGFDFPIQVDNNIGDRIGGPSAGMMFALGIYDKLTPGALTGGLKVAGTGTIDADGTVGEIGGVRQKIVGASRAGAKVFLVPAANCSEARQQDTTLRLVKVSTLKGAIADIEKLAANPKAKVPSCS